MELNAVIKKANALLAKAESTDSPEEAEACREAVDRMMTKYAIEQADLDASLPAAERMKPEFLEFPVGEYGEIIGHIAMLMEIIAKHCRCMIKHYTSYAQDEDGKLIYSSKVYGYRGDLQYFQLLWTSVRLHAIGALVPGWDKAESDEENAYRLHNAGYNWLEIQGMRGWKKCTSQGRIRREHERGVLPDDLYEKWQASKAEIWYSEREDAYKTNWQLGSAIKRAYHNACKARDEKPKKIAAGATKTYRKSAARGYQSMISQRLHAMRKGQAGGTSLVLRADALRDFFREENPSGYAKCPRCGKMSANLYTCEFCGQFIKDPPKATAGRGRGRAGYSDIKINHEAYLAGAEHAKSADLNIGDRVSSAPAKPIS